MFESVIKDYFGIESIIYSPEYEVKVKVLKTKKNTLLSKSVSKVIVLAILHTYEIPFQKIADYVLKYINSLDGLNKNKQYKWFICSNKGGIYLYEAIAIKENIKYKKMNNKYIVFNTENGNISLGPGHIKNMYLSDRTSFLLKNFRSMQKERWLKEMFSVFDMCLEYKK